MAAHLGGRRRADIKIGDKLPGMVPSYGSTCSGFVSDGQAFTATVVYIHPQRRFYTVEFDMPRGRKCRESYYFPDRAGDDTLPRKDRQPRLPGSHKKKKSKRCKK